MPKHGVVISSDSDEGHYLRAWKEEMPRDHVGFLLCYVGVLTDWSMWQQWFPPQYYLDQGGVRGHFYHVFNTVRER